MNFDEIGDFPGIFIKQTQLRLPNGSLDGHQEVFLPICSERRGGLAEAFAAKLALSSASPDSSQKSHNPAATARLKTLHSLVQAGSPHPHTRKIGSSLYIYIGYHPH